MSTFKQQLKIASFVALTVFIVSYGLFQAKGLILGVKIKNVNIENQTSFNTSNIEITGSAENAIYLSLNNREISIDKEGYFKEDIALHLGYNVLQIKAKDKFGHEDEKNYKLIYQKNI